MRLLKAGNDYRINVEEILYISNVNGEHWVHFKTGKHIVLNNLEFKDLIKNMNDETDLTWPQ